MTDATTFYERMREFGTTDAELTAYTGVAAHEAT